MICIYRSTFHPLAKYPGPWFWKITDLPGAFNVAKGQLHIVTEKAHQQYGIILLLKDPSAILLLILIGPIVRLGPTKLNFNSATALHGKSNLLNGYAFLIWNQRFIIQRMSKNPWAMHRWRRLQVHTTSSPQLTSLFIDTNVE